MRIWVDVDACPKVIKEVLYRAADRARVQVILVANQRLQVPNSPYITSVQVGRGFDVADAEILARVASNDLVITSDIPLAADVIEKEGLAMSPRGDIFSKDNIGERL